MLGGEAAPCLSGPAAYLAVGERRGLIAVIFAGAAFRRKIGIEEAVMRRQFGKAYPRYAERVPALVPFVI